MPRKNGIYISVKLAMEGEVYGEINLQVHACNNGERQSKMMENEPMNAEKKKRDLYLRQKQLLDTFLEHGAISRAQYDKSLGDLTVKMGMEPSSEPKV